MRDVSRTALSALRVPLTWPFGAQLATVALLLALGLPWVARLYAAWWDLAFGRGAFCASFLPLQ